MLGMTFLRVPLSCCMHMWGPSFIAHTWIPCNLLYLRAWNLSTNDCLSLLLAVAVSGNISENFHWRRSSTLFTMRRVRLGTAKACASRCNWLGADPPPTRSRQVRQRHCYALLHGDFSVSRGGLVMRWRFSFCLEGHEIASDVNMTTARSILQSGTFLKGGDSRVATLGEHDCSIIYHDHIHQWEALDHVRENRCPVASWITSNSLHVPP